MEVRRTPPTLDEAIILQEKEKTPSSLTWKNE